VSNPNITTAGAKSETANANFVNAKRNYERANGSFNTAKRNYNVSSPNITKDRARNETAKEKAETINIKFLILTECSNRVDYNGQGLAMWWNLKIVSPEAPLIKNTKLEVNQQKPNRITSAETTAQQR
jgi:hypothetical protein